MNKKLQFMLFALGICSTMGFAQKKEYQVESDGFEWYKISENGRSGAVDKYGNLLVPPAYYYVSYMNASDFGDNHSYLTEKAGHFVCRKEKFDNDSYFVIYNKRGEVLLKTRNRYSDIYLTYHIPFKKFCFHVSQKKEGGKNRYGIISKKIEDANPCVYDDISAANSNPIKVKQDGQWRSLSTNQISSLLMGIELFKNNNPYTESISSLQWGGLPSSHNSSTTGSTTSLNSSTSSNSGNGSSTVVVEHQHTPQPVQEWQACFGCGGMGTMGCDNCGGSGTKYIGDRLHRCSRCNGRGIIPCNICYGSKGKYVTVYR